MPFQRRRVSFRGTRASSSLESPPASRTNAAGGLVRAPGVYVGTAPSIGGLGARVTRRALGISSVFLQGLRSSGLATVPASGLERSHTSVEDLGGCLVEYMAKIHALEQVSQELETQLRAHLESRAQRSGGWGALQASWASSCQQVGEAVLENARLMLQTETIQAGADDFKERAGQQETGPLSGEDHDPISILIPEDKPTRFSFPSNFVSLLSPLEFTRGVCHHFQDVKVLYTQLAGSELEQIDAPIGPGLDGILEAIRTQWERDVEKNRVEAGALLQAKQQAEVACVAPTQEAKMAAALRVELHNTSCQVQSLQAETESLRALVSEPRRAVVLLVLILTLNSQLVIQVIICNGLASHRI
uniref:Beaded filament structural protein 2 n=1 Tax=Oryctolagus cuniculus TaxID=9986 RepID=G1TW70_RABIT